MKPIYKKIWNSAEKHYKKGRPMDIPHATWMTKEAEKVCKKENLDDSIIIPLVILHDVGYSVSPHVYFDRKLKGIHMKKGKVIAEKILKKLNYPKDKTKKICYYVSVHDNWIYGDRDIYKNNKELGICGDLDFIWMVTPLIFKRMENKIKTEGKIFEQDKWITNRKDLIKELIREGKERGFSSKTTKKLFWDYIKKLKK